MHLRLLSKLFNQEINVAQNELYLRAPVTSDFDQWVKLRTESIGFLKPWEPLWPEDDLTQIGFKRRLRSYNQQRQNGTSRTFFLFTRNGNHLIGGISLTRISHGISKSAMLGYWMGAGHAGKGHMRKTVPAVLDFAFSDLKLQRVEAACIPRNETSLNLLTKCGFEKEGYAKEYLEINGKREDHILFAIRASKFIEQNA